MGDGGIIGDQITTELRIRYSGYRCVFVGDVVMVSVEWVDVDVELDGDEIVVTIELGNELELR
jgi:hypothetical protein